MTNTPSAQPSTANSRPTHSTRFVTTALGLLAAALALPTVEAAAKKNVLLLISDNHSRVDVGCYGNAQLKTPNFDAMAKRGTRFQNAFATVSSCGPSRGVIYT